jgi:nicotinamidase-related amidase
VAKIVSPIKHLLQSAWERGIQNIVLIQDTHAPDAVEFGQYAPHCIRGTTESQTVPEIQSLPFFDQLTIIPKNSISPMFRTAFPDWVKSHPDVDTFITVGDCTDICTYQLAIDLRAEANAWQMRRRVILPIDCTDTYDLSKDTADSVGALPHPADLLHSVFLYHMALNGIELVKRIRS